MLIPISADDAERVVEEDVRTVMERVLPPEGEGYAPGAPFTSGFPGANDGDAIDPRPLHDADEVIHVVPWAWTGVDSRGLFELGATGERVTLRGVTFVTRVDAHDDDDARGFQLYRYVDWLDVFGQAGISIATRPIFDTRRAIPEERLRTIPELDQAYRIVEERDAPLDSP
jgi:hypothetical protein